MSILKMMRVFVITNIRLLRQILDLGQISQYLPERISLSLSDVYLTN